MLNPGESHEARIGLVQVFTGDGKGKTTAAMGTAVRALGQGLKVCVIFFMKAGLESGEFTFLSRHAGITLSRFGTSGFIDPKNITPEQEAEARLALEAARDAALSGKYDLIILDEVNLAVSWKMIDVEELAGLIREKPRNVELILTGRQADKRLIELADLVTECREVKHPFNKGITARKGIEY